ncbi:hypothetical protein N566_22775 [Streptomycetaceae bacterium MP113-05]|nr:hypothetical protein N566_22775 [Streptomycetaceae bacterium MP113-05]
MSGGINALRQVEGHAQAAKPLLDQTLGRHEDSIPDSVPTDPETLVKIDAAMKIGAGAALAFGKAPRVAALFLLGSLIPTTAAAHRFWEETDPARRDEQLAHFLKNCALAGGLLLAAADTHGKPSAAWLARHGAHAAGKRLGSAGHAAEVYAAHTLKHHVKHAKHGAKQARLGLGADGKAGKAGKLFGTSRKSSLAKVQHAVLEARQDGMRKGRKAWGKSRKSGMKKAQQSLHEAQKHRADLAKKARHSVKEARKSDLARRAEHGARQAQHMTRARARQAHGYARSTLSQST